MTGTGMRLDSFNAGYCREEDRLLLQAIGDGVAQSFWITRRAALMLGEGIHKVLAEQCIRFSTHQVPTQHVPEMLSFDRETAAASNPPRPGTLMNDAENKPLLLFGISYVADDDIFCTIQLTDQRQQGYCYRLTRDMLHALLNLIQSQCDLADWGVRLSQPVLNAGPRAQQSLH